MQDADLADVGLLLEVLIAALDLEARRRKDAEGPFLLFGPVRQNEQSIIGTRARTTEPAAAALPADTQPLSKMLTSSLDSLVADHGFLRLGSTVLDDDLDLLAEEAALGVQCFRGQQQAVAPCSIVDARSRSARPRSRS